MPTDIKPVHEYIKSLEKELSVNGATEHTHRPALKTLFQTIQPDIIATNEPQQIIDVGAPDFRIIKNKLATGYTECKDIGKNLDDTLDTNQLKRYLRSFNNFILTDYLEFRWFVGGKLRLKATIGTRTKDKIKPDKDGIQAVADLLFTFLNHNPEPIGSPRELAGHMARLAHMIRDIIIDSLKNELAAGSLHAQWQAFRDNLIPELSVEQFADMYAQTIAYGLFAARCETDNGKDFTRQQAAYLIPKTNPFLRKLFNHIAGPELDASITWAVDDLAQILAWADMEAVLKGFGKSTGKEDPVVHFYETFLKEYDPKTREMRGVYYTPLPVVSYIVRSIDHILKTRFEKPQGLADPSVLVLDPSVGTATFLYMVMQEIHNAVIKQGQQGTWNDYVTDKLLPRLFGFELLMAPYAIAHLKLGLLLKETDYQFQTDQRLGIYLTNTLEEAVKHAETMFAQWITEEANSAADIKKTKPIMVVLGNPPYSGASANKGNWAKELVQRYYQVDGGSLGEKNPKWLQDDYVKFLAFGQWRIEQTKQGVLGFITNHSYLDNPTFRGMRQSLMNTFSDIYILNLHGNSKKKEVAPDGSKDENVFDIQQGVSIGIFIKEVNKSGSATVHYADLWGKRQGKYVILTETNVTNTSWKVIKPTSPHYLYLPQDIKRLPEYEKGWKINSVFPINTVGLYTAKDALTIQSTHEAMDKVIHDFALLSTEQARDKYELGDDSDTWTISRAQKDLLESELNSSSIIPISYRPFDIRYTYYTGRSMGFHCRPRSLMNQMTKAGNLGLVVNKQIMTSTIRHTFVTNNITDLHIIEAAHASAYIFPLYLYPTDGEMQFGEGRRANLSPDFISAFSEKLKLKFVEDGKGDLQETFGPEDIFNYAYAVFHSLTYRTRYAEFLKIDFPRLPITSVKKLFKSLAEKGAVLVALHLMESPLLNAPAIGYPVSGEHEVEKVVYDEKTRRVNINKKEYFEGVPPEVWNFHIGGYQVCQKWLKDRKGRKLLIDDINHYQKIVVALKETIRLMSEIDKLIFKWPIE